jgi:hypothetical protein
MEMLPATAPLGLALLVALAPLEGLAAPRAAAVVTTRAGLDPARRADLARAALTALDQVPGVEALRAPALREALVPQAEAADPAAEAQGLAAAAHELAPKNLDAAIALYERAVTIAALRLPAADARAWVDRNGPRALEAMERAKVASPGAARLRRWLKREPGPAPAEQELEVTPAEARVFLDGWPVGSGPRLRVRHDPGEHDLRVEGPGFQPHGLVLDLQPKAPPLTVILVPLGPVEDVRVALREIDRAGGELGALVPRLVALGRRLEVALLFLVTPEEGGALVRIFDVEAEGFGGASPVTATDPATLSRAFRALHELRGLGTDLARPPRTKPKRPKGQALWKKWWFWTIVISAAGIATGAVLLTRQSDEGGTLTLRLRRAP